MQKDMIGYTYVLFRGGEDADSIRLRLNKNLPDGSRARYYKKPGSKCLYIDIDHTDHMSVTAAIQRTTDLHFRRKPEAQKVVSYVFNAAAGQPGVESAMNVIAYFNEHMRKKKQDGLTISLCSLGRHPNGTVPDDVAIYVTLRANDQKKVEAHVRRLTKQNFEMKPGYGPK